jgi:hypothetical protein
MFPTFWQWLNLCCQRRRSDVLVRSRLGLRMRSLRHHLQTSGAIALSPLQRFSLSLQSLLHTPPQFVFRFLASLNWMGTSVSLLRFV